MNQNSATGAELIAAERQRQIEVEGWTPEHDMQHAPEDFGDGPLVEAARCYLSWGAATYGGAYGEEDRGAIERVPDMWPWAAEFWKPSGGRDRVRDLVKAGALIAAEIDRQLAAAAAVPPSGVSV